MLALHQTNIRSPWWCPVAKGVRLSILCCSHALPLCAALPCPALHRTNWKYNLNVCALTVLPNSDWNANCCTKEHSRRHKMRHEFAATLSREQPPGLDHDWEENSWTLSGRASDLHQLLSVILQITSNPPLKNQCYNPNPVGVLSSGRGQTIVIS